MYTHSESIVNESCLYIHNENYRNSLAIKNKAK